jgi:hypothetical protein
LHGVTLPHSRKGRRWGLSFALDPLSSLSFLPSKLVQNCTPKKKFKRKKLLLKVLPKFDQTPKKEFARFRQVPTEIKPDFSAIIFINVLRVFQ